MPLVNHHQVASIVMGFREALVEEMENAKMAEKNWKTIAKRVLSNIFFIIILCCTAYAVILVVERLKKINYLGINLQDI